MTQTPFESLEPRKKTLQRSAENTYRVYSDAVNFKLVQAESAQAAFKASGLSKAFRIEREGQSKQNVVKRSDMIEITLPAEPAQPALTEVAAPPAEASAPAAAEPLPAELPPPTASASPLSQEDVTKLLNQ